MLGSLAPGQVDEGFCKGVCVDWTRRVLQGGNSIFTQKQERIAFQTNRQATAQLNIESRNASYNKLIGVRNQLVNAYNPVRNQPTMQIAAPLQSSLMEYIDFQPTTNRTYNTSRVAQWLTLLSEIGETYDHTSEVGWTAFVQVMDRLHLQKRQEQQRTGSSRPFSHIRILAAAKSKQYASIRAAMNELLQLDTFVEGTVLLLGFGIRTSTSNTGHAVAVHRINLGSYRFLDPNYGVFDYNLSGVFSALLYLFGTDYGTPIYGEGTDQVTRGVSYILFGRAV